MTRWSEYIWRKHLWLKRDWFEIHDTDYSNMLWKLLPVGGPASQNGHEQEAAGSDIDLWILRVSRGIYNLVFSDALRMASQVPASGDDCWFNVWLWLWSFQAQRFKSVYHAQPAQHCQHPPLSRISDSKGYAQWAKPGRSDFWFLSQSCLHLKREGTLFNDSNRAQIRQNSNLSYEVTSLATRVLDG